MITTIMSKNGTKTINLNRRIALHERCLNCVAWESHGVTKCEDVECDLYPFRSGNGKQSPRERSRAIKRYCKEWCSNGKVRYCGAKLCPLFSYIKSG